MSAREEFAAKVAQLRSWLDEAERVAGAASPGPWRVDRGGSIIHSGPSESRVSESWGAVVVAGCGAHDLSRPGPANAAHIARWSPTEVAALVGAVRQVVAIAEDCLGGDPYREGTAGLKLVDALHGAIFRPAG